MIKVCALASGSNGNCYYIGNNHEGILIDAGISRRKIVERMKARGINPAIIKAGFITHEHQDHYRGARVFGQKHGIPFYISEQTLHRSYYTLRPPHIKTFTPGDEIQIGQFKVHSFLKKHDAAEPCSFRVQTGNYNIGVFTDIGEPCENVKSHLSLCDFLFLESNYDDALLASGRYPAFLKQRVAGEYGHLSNKQAVELIENHASEKLKTIFLSHISEDNNRGDIALFAFEHLNDKYDIRLTSRYDATELMHLEDDTISLSL
ncbi:Phosphoribosyl 1,2-cyclic phosphodiesterase [Saccharicrinis carchari]|uniref:Phosphoribosyl 1,2-cyclic phosphodiesterase n=1 Tax=Saccharicrinis carchari TaxID=1168039 RepID=A0A521DZN0_SACCC|nr:MBL fold metallo-hydrolase [Saccharicrinis carchari]SMO76531.1 Phosphoribosyl 1,2-cyclic phosphodiesterase [Saccharicrinis carchari]